MRELKRCKARSLSLSSFQITPYLLTFVGTILMNASHLSQSLLTFVVLIACSVSNLTAKTIQVPQDHKTIQSAIDSSKPGDVIMVQPGTYRERILMKPGITVRSVGDDSKGMLGLKRAEMTILDGNVKGAKGPGVTMAESSTLDGFTVTGVGKYDDALWKKHHETLGEEQPDERIGAPGTAGISVTGITTCTIRNNIVHHIGYTGIAIMGAKGKRVSPHVVRNVTYRNMGGGIGSMKKSTAIIEENLCFENYYAGIGHNNASPLVINNVCHSNVRAGIGISEGSCPIVRGNKCYKNRRAGIGIRTGEHTQPVVEDNDCHENEMAGIGNREKARPIIRNNRCYKNRMAGIGSRDEARAVIEGNECYENEMAGIGSRLGAAPVIRDNRCYKNRMAGIGAREKAHPVIVDNECFDNRMAGIGNREDAFPIIRGNRCYRNDMAGIGARLGARPIIAENECFENKMAGIGTREGARAIICDNHSHKNQMAGIGARNKDTHVVIIGNRCIENRLVAIGLPDGATGFVHGNELQRTGGGAPPLVAVKGGSKGVVSHNSIRGGGVAGVLVQGDITVMGNRFFGAGKGQGSAIWVWKDSLVKVIDNHVTGYRNVVNASNSSVVAVSNVARSFEGASIIVKKSTSPPYLAGNVAISDSPKSKVVDVDNPVGANGNVLKAPEKGDEELYPNPQVWPTQPSGTVGDLFHPLAGSGNQVTVEDGPWKLVVTRGKTTTYALYNTKTDPGEKTSLAEKLEQITFRLRGLAEQREKFQPGARGR